MPVYPGSNWSTSASHAPSLSSSTSSVEASLQPSPSKSCCPSLSSSVSSPESWHPSTSWSVPRPLASEAVDVQFKSLAKPLSGSQSSEISARPSLSSSLSSGSVSKQPSSS